MSKVETIQKMITRKRGASMVELQKATGWQGHSVRAAVSRMRGTLTIRPVPDGKRGQVYHGERATA